MRRTFDAHIVHTADDCTIHFPAEKWVYSELRKAFADGEKVTVEIKGRRKPRSLSANNYLHMCLQIIADETGNSLESVKSTLKGMYAKKPLLDKDEEPIIYQQTGESAMYIQDTSDMSSVEFGEFVEHVKVFSIDFCGFSLPEPNDNIELKFK